jgi:hypothetical protein
MLDPTATAISRRTKSTLDNGKRHARSRAGPLCFSLNFVSRGAFRHVLGASLTSGRANPPKTRLRHPRRAAWRRPDSADNSRAG